MERRILVSVVIPTYNRPSQLIQALSALACLECQGFDFEVIVVNDGGRSVDRNARRFEEKFPLKIVWQSNTGPAAARNHGVEHARGTYLAFTDDDCRPDPDWLLAGIRHYAATTDCMLGGRTLNACHDNACSVISQMIVDEAYRHYNADWDRATFFASNNMIMPADQFRNIGGFDPAFRTSEDRDLCDRWLRRGYAMRYAPDMVVRHWHALNVKGLWSQHFAYGRGAWNYHAARAARGAGPFRPNLPFYAALLTGPLRYQPRRRAMRLAALLLIAQAANAAGFASEWVRAAR